MSPGRVSGTPWHVEVLRMDEIDDRRHRSRCVYYVKTDKYCVQYIGRCRGSAHCPYYEEGEPVVRKPSPQNRKQTNRKTSSNINRNLKKNPKRKVLSKQKSTSKNNTQKIKVTNKPINMSFNQALKNINK